MGSEITDILRSKQLRKTLGDKPTFTPQKFSSNRPAKPGGYSNKIVDMRSIEKICIYIEAERANYIEIVKEEAGKEKLGHVEDIDKIKLLHQLDKLKEQEQALIYNYLAKHK